MSILDFIEERRSDEATHIVSEEEIFVEKDEFEELIELANENEQEIIELFKGDSVVLTFKINSGIEEDIIVKALQKHLKGITHHTDDLLIANVSSDPFIVKFPKLKTNLIDLKNIASSFLKCIDDMNVSASVDFDIYEYGVQLVEGRMINFDSESKSDNIDEKNNDEPVDDSQDEDDDIEGTNKYVSVIVDLNENSDEIQEVLFKYNPKFHDNLSICEDLLKVIDINTLSEGDKGVIVQILFNESKGSQRGSYICGQNMGIGWDEKHIMNGKKLKKTTYGVKSMRTIAKRNDKAKYKIWLESHLKHYVGQCLKPTSSYRSVANLLYQIYMEKFICEGVQGGTWYEFKETHYELLDDAVVIRRLLSTKIRKRFEAFYGTEAQESAIRIMKSLETPAYKSGVMKEASELFYVKRFLREKDTNINLFAFKNLVFDCERKVVRRGLPDDWITLCSDVKYKEYRDSDEDVKSLKKYLGEVFTNESLREYFVLAISSCLQGINNDKSLYILSGQKSNNAKSTTISILTLGFGTYAVSPDSSVLTNKQQINPNAPSPALETLRNKRIAFFQEPSPDESINVGFTKKLTSKYNKFTSRAPFGKELIEFVPQLKPFIECNEIPYISMEPAMRRRTKIIDFQSEFVDEPPENEEDRYKEKKFKIDVNFEENFKRLAPTMMWYLVKTFCEKETKGLIPPDSVVSSLGKFEKVNDHFAMFCEEILEKGNETDEVKVKNLYIAYSTWYKNANIKKPIVSKDRFYMMLEKERINVDTSQQPHKAIGIKIRQI